MTLPPYKSEKMRLGFLRTIQLGIEAAGVRVRRKRPGLVFEMAGASFTVWVDYYHDQRFWRISAARTGGWLCELTMLAEEFGSETGSTLVEFLLPAKPKQWSMFAHDPSYPHYAWSKAARIEMNREAAKQAERLKRRDEARKSKPVTNSSETREGIQ